MFVETIYGIDNSMRKKELIHTHGLIAEITRNCIEEDDLDVYLDEYHEFGVKPTALQTKKSDHKVAIQKMTEALCNEIEEKTELEWPEMAAR